MALNTSIDGINLIKKFEGCPRVNGVIKAYQDAIGIWTIGWGHTGYVPCKGKNVCAGMILTDTQATELLKSDLKKFEDKVNKYNSKYNWNQNEFDAMVSFAFNLGSIDQLTANGTRSKSVIADKILAYNKAGGRVLNGLTTRRKAERELFLKKASNSTPSINNEPKEENTSFMIKVTADSLKIREGAGVKYKQVGSIRNKGVYTIVKTKDNWGFLKSGAGWICLDYTKKV